MKGFLRSVKLIAKKINKKKNKKVFIGLHLTR